MVTDLLQLLSQKQLLLGQNLLDGESELFLSLPNLLLEALKNLLDLLSFSLSFFLDGFHVLANGKHHLLNLILVRFCRANLFLKQVSFYRCCFRN